MRQQFKQSKPKPFYPACNIKFPERVWELTDNGWSSRPVLPDDLKARHVQADILSAVLLP